MTPLLIRFGHAEGRDRREPTLLIKARTLLVEHIVLRVPMPFRFRPLGDQLLCGLKILDDVAEGLIQSD